MVGPPKTLHDLRRVDGAVRVTCRTCGHVATLDREALIRTRMGQRRSCEWDAVRAELVCRSRTCDSHDVKVDGVPFALDPAETRVRRALLIRANLALSVLFRAAYPLPGETAIMPEAVRLALRTVHPHVGRPDLLAEFWRRFTEPRSAVHDKPCEPLSHIVDALLDHGVAVDAEWRWISRQE